MYNQSNAITCLKCRVNFLKSKVYLPQYLNQFNIIYIIFRNVEVFAKYYFLKENLKYNKIFEIVSFVKKESSKLINYLINMC
jgi:hypothetical protein